LIHFDSVGESIDNGIDILNLFKSCNYLLSHDIKFKKVNNPPQTIQTIVRRLKTALKKDLCSSFAGRNGSIMVINFAFISVFVNYYESKLITIFTYETILTFFNKSRNKKRE
jgi:hypothetical protein